MREAPSYAKFVTQYVRLVDHEQALTEQRQILDEQVEENRGLRSDVKLMQQANAKQRQEIERLQAELARLKSELSHWSWVRFKQIEEENARLREALENLYALVQGECPRLLNEDSGGDAQLSMEIEQALKEHP